MHTNVFYIALFRYLMYLYATMTQTPSYSSMTLGLRWEAMLRDLEEAFSIGITLHDLLGLFSDSNGNLLISGRHLHPHTVCQRHDPRAYGHARCSEDCVVRVNSQAAALRRPFQTVCWKGICEVIVPLIRQEKVVAILFAGAFRAKNHPGPDPRRVPAHIRQTWETYPLLHHDKEQTLARLLSTLGHGMLYEVETLHQINRSTSDRREQIRRFIYDHAHEPIHMSNLAAHLHLSASRTGHLVQELFGESFSRLIQDERLRRACALLRNSHGTVKMIGESVGIDNPYYFSRLFKTRVGCTPLAYRTKVRTQTTPFTPPAAS